MNEQEHGMIDGLFERLQQAEARAGTRDEDAEALIRDRMARQPAAPYLLTQVVLVQEQGLRNLQTRVEELERRLAERPQGGGGFLGGLFGGGQTQSPPQPATRTQQARPVSGKSAGWSNSPPPPVQGAAGAQAGGQGGGFMAGAMQTAMGVAGGMLLANAVSGLFSDEAEAAETPVEPEVDPMAAAPEEEIDAPVEEDGGLFGGFDDGGGDEF